MKNKLYYGWIVVGVTFLTLLVAAGIRSTPGVLILPLEQEFGWELTDISLALSVNILFYGLAGPFMAAVIDRLGMRKTMVLSLTLLAAGTALTTLMTQTWHLLLLWGVLVGLGTGTMSNVLGAMVANRWFVQHRGMVVGILTASAATGQLLFLPLLAQIAMSAGWRQTAFTTSIAALVLIPLVWFLLRDRPRDVGLAPLGASEEEAAAALAPPVATGNLFLEPLKVLRVAVRSKPFWLLAGTFFFCGFSTNGLIGTHLIPACVEHGIPEVTAAGMLALMGLFDLVGTTASGWLSDRFDNRWLLFWYYGLRGLSLLFLPYALDSGYVPMLAFTIFYGLDWIATVPPTVRLTADLFGKEKVGMVYGWIACAHQLGAATAAYEAGLLHSLFESYAVPFLLSGGVCILAAAMALRIKRPVQATS
ncbi:MFS transporter [Tumebacillus permanentifrigoris]|uniref:Sugar phosphate permease n=1 Tax=Tumebacillus permanentifrigoris TaxID=378543 RepID=A0A316DB66_9BACL|nr:MFS transporter [Tumebacillus permanentifrigoris]PWK14845.1 sugar phosphate permease [Tumebacillus permanentifrigoris]